MKMMMKMMVMMMVVKKMMMKMNSYSDDIFRTRVAAHSTTMAGSLFEVSRHAV